MDISCIQSTGLTGTQLKSCAAETGTDSEWVDALSTALDSETDAVQRMNFLDPGINMSWETFEQQHICVTSETSTESLTEALDAGSAERDVTLNEPVSLKALENVTTAAVDSGTGVSYSHSYMEGDTVVQMLKSIISTSDEKIANSILDNIVSDDKAMNKSGS